jgi:hypothetical protein
MFRVRPEEDEFWEGCCCSLGWSPCCVLVLCLVDLSSSVALRLWLTRVVPFIFNFLIGPLLYPFRRAPEFSWPLICEVCFSIALLFVERLWMQLGLMRSLVLNFSS